MVVQNHIEFAEMAAVLGKEEDAARWSAMVPTLKQQYHESFYDPESASYGTGNPTSFACALWLEVTPLELLPRVVDNFVKVLHSANYRMTSMGFIGVRYVFEALTKVNRTDVALRMLHSREYPSFGWCMTNNFTGDQATSLWESYDAPTMHQWLDESSRDHHYSASINTALRKDLAGLDMPTGSNAWSTVKCRPEAAHWPHLLPSASATLHSRRGTVACSWSATTPVSPAPPPAMFDAPTVQCAISKIWTGASSLLPSFPPCLSACLPVPARVGCWLIVRGPSRLLFDAQTNELLCTGAVSGPAPMVLRCPARETITKLEFARFGKSTDPSGPDGWYCYGPQPPPFAKAVCGADVAGKLAGLCVGRNTCDLSASSAKLDNPCAPPLPPNNCPPGQHVDYVEAPGDNGSCDCDIFCAADWDNQIKAARPHWTGATSLGSNTTTSCRCVQATHWCPHGKAGGCAAACDKVGKPKAAHVCVTGPVPPPPTDPNLQLIVRVACSGGSATPFATPTAVDDLNELGSGQVLATVNITVPGGSHGEVHVPIMSADSGTITQSGRVVWSKGQAASSLPRGLSFMANDGRRFAMFATGAGSWSFVSAV